MTWIIIRTSGFVAFAFLASAAIWGLIVSTGLLGRSVSAKKMTYMHESLSIAAILSTLVHVLALYMDEFIEFTAREILVPGASDWRPQAVSLGTMAMYGLIFITGSFYIRKWITQRVWRTLHFISFGVFVSALWHGVSAGTDTSTPIAIGIYTATVAIVLGLVGVRIITLKQPSRPGRQPRPARATEAAAPAITPDASAGTRPFGSESS